ncbi:MAG: hypothetical protein VKJ64_07330 [Leptolyngbyaceae bacterium]|nr:hypothetical protein [Leptolyngbyaceae bacterium]
MMVQTVDLSENWGGVPAQRVLHPNFRTTLVVISEKTSFYDLETNFNLRSSNDRDDFVQWHRDRSELTIQEKDRLDQVKANFLTLTRRSLISENLVNIRIRWRHPVSGAN